MSVLGEFSSRCVDTSKLKYTVFGFRKTYMRTVCTIYILVLVLSVQSPFLVFQCEQSFFLFPTHFTVLAYSCGKVRKFFSPSSSVPCFLNHRERTNYLLLMARF